MLIGIIIGALVWQLVVVSAYLFSKQNEDTTILWGMGIWRIITYTISIPIFYFDKWLKSKRYVAMMLNTNGVPCYCKSSDEPELLRNIGYTWNEGICEKYKMTDGWKKDYTVCGHINIRYTPIKIAKLEGAYRVDKEIIKEARQILKKETP